MSLKAKLLDDLKEAMKNKDVEKKTVIQILKTEILYLEKEKQAVANKNNEEDAEMSGKEDLSETEILAVITKEIKKRQDVLPEYIKSNREDLIKSVNTQLEILQSYLPKQLSDDELKVIVTAAIAEIGATSMKEMGQVVNLTKEKVAGGADNGRISKMIKEMLG